MQEQERDPALDALLKQAEEVDEGAAAPEVDAAPQPPEPVNSVEQVAGMLSLAVGLLVPMFPSLAKVYTEQTIQALAGVTVPLANKHGWNINGMLGGYAEEIAFAAVALPLGLATYQVVLHDLQRKDETQPEPRPLTVPEE